MIQPGAKRPVCPRRSPSRPSPRLRSIRSVRLPKPACHAGHPHGCRLWQRYAAAHRRHRARVPLCRRDPVEHLRLGTGGRTAAAQAVVGPGTAPKLTRRDGEHQPTSVKALALALEQAAWAEITWREGAADRLTSRFARVRVRAAHRDYWLGELRPEEWLLIEWPEGEKEPTKY